MFSFNWQFTKFRWFRSSFGVIGHVFLYGIVYNGLWISNAQRRIVAQKKSKIMAMMQDSESDDFSDSEYEEMDIENSGSDSSVCSLIKDDSSRNSDLDDLPAVCQQCTIQNTKVPLASVRFAFTANAGMNFNIDICNVLEFFYKHFANELIDIITAETNRYAEERARRLHSKPWCSTSQDEIRDFWGITILQGVMKKQIWKIIGVKISCLIHHFLQKQCLTDDFVI